jgi:hypothetical protein
MVALIPQLADSENGKEARKWVAVLSVMAFTTGAYVAGTSWGVQNPPTSVSPQARVCPLGI